MAGVGATSGQVPRRAAPTHPVVPDVPRSVPNPWRGSDAKRRDKDAKLPSKPTSGVAAVLHLCLPPDHRHLL